MNSGERTASEYKCMVCGGRFELKYGKYGCCPAKAAKLIFYTAKRDINTKKH